MDNMPSSINALQGVLQYISVTKPFHTQVLDIEIDYSFREDMLVSISEQAFQMDIELTGDNKPLEHQCSDGYGIVWDDNTETELLPQTTIISASAPEIITVAPYNSAGSPLTTQQLQLSNNTTPNFLPVGTQVTFSTNSTLPTTTPQIYVGVPYEVSVSSVFDAPGDYIEVSIDGETITWMTDTYTGDLYITPINETINSFLIDTTINVDYTFTADNITNTLIMSSPRPQWPVGTKVRVSSTGTLPAPLLPDVDYYVQPIPATDSIQLSYVRYPQHYSQYINITSIGTGTLTITRSETFYNGQKVEVVGSYLNDGIYFVHRVVQENPTQERVYVLGRVTNTTPNSLLTDGTMMGVSSGYSDVGYCPPSNMSNLHVEASMCEKLLIEIDEETFTLYIGGLFDNL